MGGFKGDFFEGNRLLRCLKEDRRADLMRFLRGEDLEGRKRLGKKR